ncbi:MAG TPA: uracil-DNA glycosylase [Gemmatimonadaceae bacterium]|nr:uracil-DNA glycosylase [Gemmatimonadaceae bacterium]
MDAREQLRRYLEQRRELGESELTLDHLSVEDAMRLLGAGGATTGARAAAPDSSERRSVRDAGAAMPADWREALKQAGASPEGGAPKPAARTPIPKMAFPAPEAAPASEDAKAPADAAASPPVRDGARTPDPSHTPAAPQHGIVIGTSSRELFGGGEPQYASLDDIAAAVRGCTKCPLSSTALNPVPGEGNPNADFMCVGEAPGATEDETGRPFVGQAGQLLTKILAAINLSREDVFICNVLKHRPPGNRNPMPNEVAACSPYLIRQIELIRPKVILALGTFAAQTLLDTRLAIGKLRGQVHRYYGVPLIVTYHPAALLRNPSWKRPTWEDVQLARRILDDALARG